MKSLVAYATKGGVTAESAGIIAEELKNDYSGKGGVDNFDPEQVRTWVTEIGKNLS